MILTDEHLCPTFNHAPDGADETYDTLDNIDLGGNNCVEALFKLITPPLEGAVGVVVMGESSLSDASDGYWGRAVPLTTGERMQMRIHPRNSAGKPLGEDEARFLATRQRRMARCRASGTASSTCLVNCARWRAISPLRRDRP